MLRCDEQMKQLKFIMEQYLIKQFI